MPNNTLIGIVLIVVGVVALAVQGFTYTTREKAVDIGPLQIVTENTKSVPLPPIIGVAALVGGVAMLVAAKRKA